MPTDTAATGRHATWAAFASEAPELATRVAGRFAANLHHVVGTLRSDGAPRLSGTEVTVDDERVTLGMMAGSHKLADVRRDPRVEIHSAPLEDDLSDGDAKLSGRLLEIPPTAPGHPGAGFFELAIERVSLVRVGDDELVLETWRPGRGHRETRRS